ncbi:Protein of unknown function [Pustulibacterium marinum]|uniref:DUF4240 domain-containing protein n=1 Tax=Pustulibacterium marinum TaxID=1224947 RepID=A0A1I7I3H2_9FLAO|nr:DUF4240 domain-containing protein [Pustulibacterium marinum]SFU67479.1 Protein of unknown function [Pustulibacterium marinum]
MNGKEGDIYITKLERDFFGAFKVIKIGKSFFEEIDGDLMMLGVLNYVDKKKPELNDERLNQILCCNRFLCSNQYAIDFYTNNPKYNDLSKFEYLGNRPMTEFETSIDFKLGDGRSGLKGGFPLVGLMGNDYGKTAFFEWRWENEKEEFKKEVEVENEKARIAREEYRKQSMKPKKMLDDNMFWEVIEKIDWTKDDDQERMEPAIDFLAKKKVSEIKQFQESLAYKLYLLDTKEHAQNIGEDSFKDESSNFSVDYFLYVRCCVIANGQEYFESVLKNPKDMPKDKDFEPLLYIAEEAYEKRMNKELEYETGCDYETFSNYKGWKK